jgi:hypothetical protein
MSSDAELVIHEYARRYTARDVEGITDLCLWPFVAVQDGVPTHLPDRDAVRDHVRAMIDAYRWQGAATWAPVEIDSFPLGEDAVFAMVRWNALDADCWDVVTDSWTIYHLVAAPDRAEGWRFLSCTKEF